MNMCKPVLVVCMFIGTLSGVGHVMAEAVSSANTNQLSDIPFLKIAKEQLASMTGQVDLADIEGIAVELQKQRVSFNENYAVMAYEICEKIGGIAQPKPIGDVSPLWLLEMRAKSIRKARMRSDLAASALAGNGVSADVRMKLLPYLAGARPSLTTAVERAQWSVDRAMALVLWLKTSRDSEEEVKRRCDVSVLGPVYMRVPPPMEVNLPNGDGNPDMIDDPVLKRKWLDAIASNDAKIAQVGRMVDFEVGSRAFRAKMERYIKRCYALPPYEIDELKKLLEVYVGDKTARDRILTSVRKVWGKEPVTSSENEPDKKVEIEGE